MTATVTDLPTDTTEKPAEDTPDAFELLNSGRVRYVIDGRTYTLRAPKLGEFREYRTKLDELVAKNADADELIDFLRWTFKKFGDKRLPDETDDLPTWLSDARMPSTLLSHWRSAPLASGVR